MRENERGAEVRYRVRYGILRFEYVLQRNYKQSGWRLTWHRVEGSFKTITGEWAIHRTPDDDHQLVICKSFVDVGYFIPTAWARDNVADGVQRTAHRMRDHLESEKK